MIDELKRVSRIAAKFFFDEDVVVELPRIVPVFHRWIQEDTVPGLLIDVADYKHVHEGPGVMLIGHEGDYVIDLGQGRPGILYQGKRAWPEAVAGSLRERLALVLRLALTAAVRLEEEHTGRAEDGPPVLGPPGDGLRRRGRTAGDLESGPGELLIRGDEVVLQFSDRLRAPNSPEVVEQVRGELAPVLQVLYPGLDVEVSWMNQDPRRLLTLEVAAPGAPGVRTLLRNLEAAREGVAPVRGLQ